MEEIQQDIILCIPGIWESQSEFITSVAEKSEGWLAAGFVMMKTATNNNVRFEFQERDPNVSEAFLYAGPHWKDSLEMSLIRNHKSIVYLICDGGSIENCFAAMEAADALLKSGGLGVKIETTGIAHSPKLWHEITTSKPLNGLHYAFAIYLTGEQVYSCGMQNFGIPDAIVKNDPNENCTELLRIFTWYLLSESPDIREGNTFSIAADAPVYKIFRHEGIEYGEDSLFSNHFGTWELRKI